jgi:hypothetical protein
MNLFQIGLLFSLPVHTYLLTRETGYLITVRVLMWLPNAKLPRSAPAVLNGRCRVRLDMSQFSLGVVLRSLPARGRSVTFF